MFLHSPCLNYVSKRINLPHLTTYSHLLCTISVGQPCLPSSHPRSSGLPFQVHSLNYDFLILMCFFHLFQGNFFSFHIIPFLYAFETEFPLFVCLLELVDVLQEDFCLFVEQKCIICLHHLFYCIVKTIFCFEYFYGNYTTRKIFCSLNKSQMP